MNHRHFSSRLRTHQALIASVLACAVAPALGAITLTGDAYQSADGLYYVGPTGTGSMSITGGSSVGKNINLGGAAASDASLILTSGSTLTGSLVYGTSGNTSVTIQNGATASFSQLTINNRAGSSDYFLLDGSGTTLKGLANFSIGSSGAGGMTISNGAVLSMTGSNYYGHSSSSVNANSSGEPGLIVTGAGSKWLGTGSLSVISGGLRVDDGAELSTAAFSASISELQGSGTINVYSSYTLDADLVFDQTHGTTQSITFGNGGTLNLKLDSNYSNLTRNSGLGIGFRSGGTMLVTDGVVIDTGNATLGGSSEGVTGSATVTGAGTLWKAATLTVGSVGSGSLTVMNGGKVQAATLYANSNDLHGDGEILARGALLDGDVIFDGASTSTYSFGTGGQLLISPDGTGILGAGYKSHGSLKVINGAQVSSSAGRIGYNKAAASDAVIDGIGSQWNILGKLDIGNGLVTSTLSITDGGQVAVHDNTTLNPNSLLMTSGAGTTLDTHYLLISGNWVVQDKAKATSTTATVGGYISGTSEAQIVGPGSSWTLSDALSVGSQGTGKLLILDGGTVSSNYANIATIPNFNGVVTVSGAGSSWNITRDIRFGASTTSGNLIIENGGQVNVGVNAFVDGSAANQISLAGGTFRSKYLYLDRGDRIKFESGKLLVTDGGFFRATSQPQLFIPNQGTLGGTGRIEMAVNLAPGAHLAPGDTLGRLELGNPNNISPNVTILTMSSGSSLDFEIGGYEIDQYDSLNIYGAAILRGTLSIRIVNGFVPKVGDAWSLFGPSGDIGYFENVTYLGDGIYQLKQDGYTFNINGGFTRVVAVPEPAGVMFLSLGLLTLRRRRLPIQ